MKTPPRIAKTNDILLSVRAPIGRVNIAKQDTGIGRGLMAIRGSSSLNTLYLAYFLESLGKVWGQFESGGSVFSNLGKAELAKIPIPLPPLDEQRGIAATLGALDDKIESNRRLIRLINDLLDSMALLLGSKLPSVALGDLVASSSQTVNPLRLGEQVVDHFSLPAFDSMQTPERIPASEIMSNKLAISEPCILISRLNPRVNRTWLAIPELGYPALASTEFLCVLPKGRVEIGAIWLALRDEFFISELRRRVTGTSGSHQRVRPNDALSIEVPDVRKIAETEKLRVTALLEIEHQRKAENQHLSRLRDSLLPELLSGRIRVPEAHETVQEVIA